MMRSEESTPRLLFRKAFPQAVWRIWPAPGLLALELRDVAAQTVTFVVLRTTDGHEHLRYHDPAVPWWLALAGLSPTALLLHELHPDQLGLPVRQQAIPLPALAAEPAAVLQVPVSYPPDALHYAALARFVVAQTGNAPTGPILYMEGSEWLLFAVMPPSGQWELLICAARTGAVTLRAALGTAPLAPDAPLFCTFGPILYALGAPGEVFAWHLPTA